MKFHQTLNLLLLVTLNSLFAQAYSYLSPYTYCAANPVNYTDPTGMVVEGATKEDAALAVEDFRAMFPGDEFADFRNLIVQSGKKQNGKKLSPISSEALSAAFNGISLNEDQQALVDMVVNTINSADVHKVEYVDTDGEMSQSALDAFTPEINKMGITFDTPSGYTQFVWGLCGEAGTVPTKKGSHTMMQKDTKSYITNRPATLGHEVIGHGRSHRLGYTDPQSQHVFPIQVENLILRNMGIPLYRNGTDHSPLRTFIPNYMNLPSFR